MMSDQVVRIEGDSDKSSWITNNSGVPVSVACKDLFGSSAFSMQPGETKEVSFDFEANAYPLNQYSYDDLKYSIGKREKWAVQRDRGQLVMCRLDSPAARTAPAEEVTTRSKEAATADSRRDSAARPPTRRTSFDPDRWRGIESRGKRSYVLSIAGFFGLCGGLISLVAARSPMAVLLVLGGVLLGVWLGILAWNNREHEYEEYMAQDADGAVARAKAPDDAQAPVPTPVDAHGEKHARESRANKSTAPAGTGEIGVLFDIDGLGGDFYGYSAYRVLFRTLDPKRLAGSTILDGDTTATLAGRDRTYCVAFQGVDSSQANYIRDAISRSDEEGLRPRGSRLAEGVVTKHHPLVVAGRVDGEGRLVVPEGGLVHQDWAEGTAWIIAGQQAGVVT